MACMSDAEDVKKRALWSMQPVKDSMNADRVEPVDHTMDDVLKGRPQTPGKMDFSKEIPRWPAARETQAEPTKDRDKDNDIDR